MNTHPIIFSTPMVAAILEGRKTVTRRIIKPRTPEDFALMVNMNVEIDVQKQADELMRTSCPYGKSGDTLWVRESFINDADYNQPPIYIHKAGNENYPMNSGTHWKPSIHMPKSACRLFLKVTGVRVERLQEISEADAIAEGVESFRPVPGDGPPETLYKHYLKDKWGPSPVHSFQTLWEKINGPESWEVDPWVWVINFERTDKPEKF